MIKDCKEAVEVAKRCNAKWMTVVPGNFESIIIYGISNSECYYRSPRRAAAILELAWTSNGCWNHSVIILIFSFVIRIRAYMICKAVSSPACKILFDMYHMQRNEGDIINNIDRSWEEIAYFQVGDNPGRKEPTTGEMNYKNIFKHIFTKGFRGVMEYGTWKLKTRKRRRVGSNRSLQGK